MYRFHILGVPHTKTSKEFCTCAFTQLTYKMCQMLVGLGHEVYHYGVEGSDPPCTEHIDVVADDIQRQTYGKDYNWQNFFWVPKSFNDLVYTTFRNNAIKEINLRKKPKDMLLVIPGEYHKMIVDKVSMVTIEPAIGNEHPFSKFKVFASYAWMHYVYGRLGINSKTVYYGNWYDAVIPHYFNPDDFELEENKDSYYLFLGRVVPEKGVHIAAQICQAIGARLLVAGAVKGQSYLKTLRFKYPHVEYLGVVCREERNSLIAEAKALMAPSLSVESFGKPVVEALFCGTPVITTDWGSFPEIVKQDEVGYRCKTMSDFIWAAKNIDKISPVACREYAVANYSIERVSKMYSEYFDKVQDLYKGGWYEPHLECKDLDWLKRY